MTADSAIVMHDQNMELVSDDGTAQEIPLFSEPQGPTWTVKLLLCLKEATMRA